MWRISACMIRFAAWRIAMNNWRDLAFENRCFCNETWPVRTCAKVLALLASLIGVTANLCECNLVEFQLYGWLYDGACLLFLPILPPFAISNICASRIVSSQNLTSSLVLNCFPTVFRMIHWTKLHMSFYKSTVMSSYKSSDSRTLNLFNYLLLFFLHSVIH